MTGAGLALGLVLAASSTGYVRSRVETGKANDPAAHCLWWKEGTISFTQNQRGDPDAPGEAAFEAVSAGYSAWNAVAGRCGNLRLEEQPRTLRKDVGYDPRASDNLNVVVFRSKACNNGVVPAGDDCWTEGDCNNLYDCWQYSAATIGLTTTTYDRNTGRIYDADMELNSGNFRFTTVDAPPCVGGAAISCVSSDVQNTVTHEVGHFLGLDHAPASDSTMYASAPLGETSKRTLDADSEAFVCDVYPAGAPSRDCVVVPVDDTLGKQASCNAAGAALGPLSAVGLLGLLARRLRRGRR